MGMTAREYYLANRERILARAAEYRLANLDKIAAANKRYRSKHAEEISVRRSEKHLQNREKNNARSRAYYAATKDRQRASRAAYDEWYRATYPEKKCEREARRRARMRATAVGHVDYRGVLRRSAGMCGICGRPLDLFGVHFDHVVPIAKGGAHVEANIQASHAACNVAKGSRLPEEMRKSQ